MRVLHVETINQVAHTFARGLDRLGITSLFFEPSLAGASKPLPLKLFYMPYRLLHLLGVIGKLTPRYCDVAHIHWASYGILANVSRVPVVVHCHGSDVNQRADHWLGRLGLRLALRRAAAVLCISPNLLAPTRRIRPDAMLFPASIDTDQFVPEPALAARPWTVLLFARLEPLKGSPMAVEALARFATRHPEARIVLTEYGALRHEYKSRYSGIFEFVPPVTPADVRELIWQADVVVGQFVLGALGLSELQAMSCGKPVIASFVYPEAYPAPPPLCNASTAEAIEAALELLSQHRDEARALGRQAREWVIAQHGTEVLARRLARLYATLTERAAARGGIAHAARI